MSEGRVVPVEIHGQRYPIRSALDPDYVTQLAAYVDEKIRAAADTPPTGESIRLAVLAALNIADELFRCREITRNRDGELAERAGELERLLDRVLAAGARPGSDPGLTRV
jgi:cell division protein ZapA